MSDLGKSKVKITIVSTKDTTKVTDQIPDEEASEASISQVINADLVLFHKYAYYFIVVSSYF